MKNKENDILTSVLMTLLKLAGILILLLFFAWFGIVFFNAIESSIM